MVRKQETVVIDGILFDKDGTLFDFQQSWGGWAVRLLGDLAEDPDHAHALGKSIGYDAARGIFAADSPVIAGTAAEIGAALSPHLPGMTLDEVIGRVNDLASGAPMTEAVPLIPFLTGMRARGLRLGLATNDTEAPARAHLDAHRITGFFDFIAGYDSGYGAKPGPGMCLAFAQATGLVPERIAMVGDSVHDLVAGRAAGMHVVAVLTGVAGRSELVPHADVVIQDIGGLGAWLDQMALVG
jgi:phosphoglycolate phosphatase